MAVSNIFGNCVLLFWFGMTLQNDHRHQAVEMSQDDVTFLWPGFFVWLLLLPMTDPCMYGIYMVYMVSINISHSC